MAALGVVSLGAAGLTGVAAIGVAVAPPAAAATAAPVQPSPGYWMAASDGGIFTYGGAGFFGSTGGVALNKPIVTMAPTPTGKGYWEVASDGGVFTYGDAVFSGSTGGLKLTQPIVGMASTYSGAGYAMVASDGGIFSFGDAPFLGTMGGKPLNKPIVAMAMTSGGQGYWMVASDGGIFSFGTAKFFGSTGSIPLNRPIVGMAPTPSGRGYWLVASDGGIFNFGDAGFYGSTGALALRAPIKGMTPTPTGRGYWLVASDGGVFAFGDAAFAGSPTDVKLAAPIVTIAAAPPKHASDVVAFYYPWWGNPDFDNTWFHWDSNNGNVFSPPTDVASNYYPVRGAYSVADPTVLNGQFTEIAAAGIDEVVVSWWGKDSFEDKHLPKVAAAAAAHGVKVGIHLEDYPGRTAASVEADLAYLKSFGYSDYWIYFANEMSASDLSGVLDRAGNVRVMASANDIASVESGAFEDWAASAHFTGIYTYDPYYFEGSDFPGICGAARMRGLLCAPGVAPGFLGTRATGIDRVKSRSNGATYDQRWLGAVDGAADITGIVSYNEWHEGSQIEPAMVQNCSTNPSCYSDFEGAYGRVGTDSQNAYLDETRLWSSRYKNTGK
jgi:hypothetical protein